MQCEVRGAKAKAEIIVMACPGRDRGILALEWWGFQRDSDKRSVFFALCREGRCKRAPCASSGTKPGRALSRTRMCARSGAARAPSATCRTSTRRRSGLRTPAASASRSMRSTRGALRSIVHSLLRRGAQDSLSVGCFEQALVYFNGYSQLTCIKAREESRYSK